MPVGVIINSLSVFLGGLFGSIFTSRITIEVKEKLNLVFGICSIGIGISSIVLMVNMPAVVLALILGSIIGTALHLEQRLNDAGHGIQRLLFKSGQMDEEKSSLLVTTIVLFCSSGTGIYGSIISGISGDHSILITKSILDFFTAMIFSCTLGKITAFIAVPQFVIFLVLFFCAKLIYPLTTPAMISDFKSCGGLIMLATGLRIAGIKKFPVADMIPSMILVWFTSAIWGGLFK